MSEILGPNGQPINAMQTKRADFGGQTLDYFVRPGIAQGMSVDLSQDLLDVAGMPLSFADKVQGAFATMSKQIGLHDLVAHSLMREVVTLRKRIELLEQASKDQCDEPEDILR